MHTVFGRHSQNLRLAAVMLVVLALSSLAFSSEIGDAARNGDLRTSVLCRLEGDSVWLTQAATPLSNDSAEHHASYRRHLPGGRTPRRLNL